MNINGVIRCVGRYANGIDSLEIRLPRAEASLHVIDGERKTYTLEAGSDYYLTGVRYTVKNGVWISPDLYKVDNPKEKIFLSEILTKLGYRKNDIVVIDIDEVNRLASIRRKRN